MKKIPSLFLRDPDNSSQLLREPNPDSLWVFAGEGVATQKYDGACCMITDDGSFYKRRALKPGTPTPADFKQVDYDPTTKIAYGWFPVNMYNNADKWFILAFMERTKYKGGTYELLGPNVQGNPEGCDKHVLFRHGRARKHPDAPRDYDGLKEWFLNKDIEGLVFHHEDGRMAKIKKKDFGLKRQER